MATQTGPAADAAQDSRQDPQQDPGQERQEGSTASLGRRERNKAQKRARILQAARERLARDGYERMTMADVARDADVATGTVFQYVATKAELLMMVTAADWADVLPAAIREAGTVPTPEGAIDALLQPLLVGAERDPATTHLVARELLFGTPGPHHDEVVRLVEGLEDATAQVLRAAGGGERAAAAARLIVTGGLFEIHRTRTGRAADSPQDRVAQLVALVSDGTIHGAQAKR